MVRRYDQEDFWDGKRRDETDDQAIKRVMRQLKARSRALMFVPSRFLGSPLGDFDGVITGVDPASPHSDWQSLPLVIRGQVGQFRFDYGVHKRARFVHWMTPSEVAAINERQVY